MRRQLLCGAEPEPRYTYQNDVLRVQQAFDRVVNVRLRDRPLNFLLRLPHGRADATEEDVRQRSVHGNALRSVVSHNNRA